MISTIKYLRRGNRKGKGLTSSVNVKKDKATTTTTGCAVNDHTSNTSLDSNEDKVSGLPPAAAVAETQQQEETTPVNRRPSLLRLSLPQIPSISVIMTGRSSDSQDDENNAAAADEHDDDEDNNDSSSLGFDDDKSDDELIRAFHQSVSAAGGSFG